MLIHQKFRSKIKFSKKLYFCFLTQVTFYPQNKSFIQVGSSVAKVADIYSTGIEPDVWPYQSPSVSLGVKKKCVEIKSDLLSFFFARPPPLFYLWYLMFITFFLSFAGYYADPDMGCQAYHVCLLDPISGSMYPTSFLCPNGTLFQQQIFNCDWW